MTISPDELKSFVRHYVRTALWATHDEWPDGADEPTRGENLDDTFGYDDLSDEARGRVWGQCETWLVVNEDLLRATFAAHPEYTSVEGEDEPQWAVAGHDFFLTRNGHGVGFWDRKLDNVVWSHALAQRKLVSYGELLTIACKLVGETEFYAGDDGKVHIS